VLGLAQTGTGKTAAFALPILEKLLAEPGAGPRALIVAPTRELASQIDAEIRMLARHTRIKTCVIFGGVGQNPQVAALRARPQIIIACPGRLLDLMNQGAVRLDHIETLVLDEADHMFDMGFLPDIRRILNALPAERQNLLFSATMPSEIRGLARQILIKPHIVERNHSTPAATIKHALYPIDAGEKMKLLYKVLADDDFVSAIVFTRTKHRARKLAIQLGKSGHRAVALQGNMSQNARTRAMNGFRRKEYDVLVATDIAARGIDVEQVSHVVNFDMPTTPDAYTHRIGRTGRSEREGRAFTFVTTDDFEMVRAVEHRIGLQIPRRSVEGIESIEIPTGRLGNGGRPQSSGRKPASNGSGAAAKRGRWHRGGGSGRSSSASGSGTRRRRAS
jgi:ATP-dependent RNA helicase RhlE